MDSESWNSTYEGQGGIDSLDNDVSIDTEKSSKWGHQEIQTSRKIPYGIGPIPKWEYITEGSVQEQEEACGVFLNFY